jgi:hypothetical protein
MALIEVSSDRTCFSLIEVKIQIAQTNKKSQKKSPPQKPKPTLVEVILNDNHTVEAPRETHRKMKKTKPVEIILISAKKFANGLPMLKDSRPCKGGYGDDDDYWEGEEDYWEDEEESA